jgi:hypothetical protein
MTKRPNTAAIITDARADLSKAIASAWTGNVQSGNAIARIAADILRMLGNGNGAALIGDSLSLDAETLGRYARGTLSKTEADAKDSGLPTAGMVINALARTAQPVADAERALEAERKASKAQKNVILRAKHDAEAERLTQALNTLKQPIRRALVLAAYVATAGDAYRMAEASADAGKLSVPCDTGEKDDNGLPVYRAIAITYATASEAFKDAAPKRKPGGEVKQTVTPGVVIAEGTNDDASGVYMTAEAVRAGGAQRAQLGSMLTVINAIVSRLDTAPTRGERQAIARLMVTLEGLLDDTDMEYVADLRDMREEAVGE